MPSDIEPLRSAGEVQRLRFQDRQVLRAFDLLDEQHYQINERRRIVRELHPFGIVRGLEVLGTNDTALAKGAGAYVSAGLAYDAYGRAVVLDDDYPLTAADLAGQNLAPTFNVFVTYAEDETGPSTPGYSDCGLTDVNTRVRESARVVLAPATSSPNVEPPAGSPSPPGDPSGAFYLLLGTVAVTYENASPNSIVPTEPKNWQRPQSYIGVKTRRITPITVEDTNQDGMPVRDDQGKPRPTRQPVDVEGTLRVQESLIVGDDFQIVAANVKFDPPNPAAQNGTSYPAPTGLEKVAGDLFVRGDILLNWPPSGPNAPLNWMNLRSFVKALIPEFQFGERDITLSVNDMGIAVGSVDVSLTSALPLVAQAKWIASIGAVKLQPQKGINDWIAKFGDHTPLFAVTPSELKRATGSTGNTFTGSIDCSGSPAVKDGQLFPISQVTVRYLVVFYP